MSMASKSESGFSMVELLIVALILAIGLLGMTALQVMNLSQSSGGRARNSAAYIAQTSFELIEAEGRLSIAGFPPPTRVFTSAVSPADATSRALFGGFNIHGIQVTDSAGNPIASNVAMIGDSSQRSVYYNVYWTRHAYKAGLTPQSSAQQNAQEFVIDVGWFETDSSGTNVPKWISMSRYIRF